MPRIAGVRIPLSSFFFYHLSCRHTIWVEWSFHRCSEEFVWSEFRFMFLSLFLSILHFHVNSYILSTHREKRARLAACRGLDWKKGSRFRYRFSTRLLLTAQKWGKYELIRQSPEEFVWSEFRFIFLSFFFKHTLFFTFIPIYCPHHGKNARDWRQARGWIAKRCRVFSLLDLARVHC